jgi:hypothetical protein
LRVAAHDSFALLISGRALAARACEPVATAFAVRLGLVRWAVGASPTASLLWIALANARAADGACRSELTATATVFIRVIADSVTLKLASGGIAAFVVTAACCSTAVTLFIAFHNAVAAPLAGNGANALVVCETRRLDAIASEGRAHVADGAS